MTMAHTPSGGSTTRRAPVALVVDDAATMRAYHRAVLVDAGFAVREAANGYEALELAVAQEFALLVVDVNMPVMDGFTLVEAVRRASCCSAAPIIMISTEAADVDSTQAYLCGANLYLVKPADPVQLAASARLLAGLDAVVGGGS
jgi:two-component system chemotaxis response regulator CheY